MGKYSVRIIYLKSWNMTGVCIVLFSEYRFHVQRVYGGVITVSFAKYMVVVSSISSIRPFFREVTNTQKWQFEINTFEISKIMNVPLFFNNFSNKFVVFDNMRNI